MYIEKVEDLKKGDEILVSASSNLVHAILLRDPAKKDNGSWYKRTKCSINARTEQYDGRGWDSKTRTYGPKKCNRTRYEKDIFNDSRIDKYMDLQDYKMIWLLNR